MVTDRYITSALGMKPESARANVIPPLPEYDHIREFFPNQHPPRPMAPPAEEAPGEYPNTLDLRRAAVT